MFTLYLRIGAELHFLQKANVLSELQVSNATVGRWVRQMQVTLPKDTKLCTLLIYRNDVVELTANFGASKKAWTKPPRFNPAELDNTKNENHTI